MAAALGRRGISSDLCVRSAAIQTFTYTKLINKATGIEDRPRIDFINTAPLPAAVERALLDRLLQALDAFDVILVSDQAETSHGGVVTPALRDLLADLAPNYPEKIIFADSRARIGLFRNVIVKPNQQEAEAACRDLFGRIDYDALRRHVNASVLMVTHGGAGVLIIDGNGETWVKTRPVERPVDICGAGDSFSAGAATALTCHWIARRSGAVRQPGGIDYDHEARHRHGVSGRTAGRGDRMTTLAIDIGGGFIARPAGRARTRRSTSLRIPRPSLTFWWGRRPVTDIGRARLWAIAKNA